jgi:glycosyltransferase involved in cell wall biosynthesis
MKVVLLGNTARHLLTFRGPLLFAMAAAGHDVVAIGPEEDDEVRTALAAGGVGFETLPLARIGLNPASEAKTVATLVRRLRRHRPDVFFGYTIKPVIYGCLAAQLAGVPNRFGMVSGLGYAFLGQESVRRRALSRLVSALYRVGLHGSRAVFFQNPDDLADFERLRLIPAGTRRIIVNGSGVDLDAFPMRPMPDGPPIVLYAGRLLRDKGIYELIDAARLLKARRPDVRVQVLGYYDSNPACVTPAQMDAWSREGVIEFLGETRDVRPYLAAATAIVLPSYREGTPRSVLEALATGRPVVVTDVPGCRETVIDGENGFLVPPFDPVGLADGIERLLSDPDRLQRMAVRARRLAEEKYDARVVSAGMLAAMDLDRP